MSNLANIDTLEGICPQCNGSMVLLEQEWCCSQCGLRLLRWFDPERPVAERAKEFHMNLMKAIEGSGASKGSEPVSTAFLVDFLPSSSTAPRGEGGSGLPKASESDHDVPEAKEANFSPSFAGQVVSLVPILPRPPAPMVDETRFNSLTRFVLLPWAWVDLFKELRQKVKKEEGR